MRTFKKKISRQLLVSLGPHHQWSGDGHDKLSKIGFPIWAVCDQWSGKWLGMWVVPNNWLKTSIAYLYLSLVHELGGTFCKSVWVPWFILYLGMPLQMTTDCGSETTDVYGFATALRLVLLANVMLILMILYYKGNLFAKPIYWQVTCPPIFEECSQYYNWVWLAMCAVSCMI
jgi:hypothetical protein